MAPEWFQMMTVLKTIHTEITELRKELDELRDEVKCMGGMEVVSSESESEEGSDESPVSVQSAPATVSYESVL